MRIDSSSSSPAVIETERQVAVLKKSQDVAKAVGESLVALVAQAPAPAPARPGRIDTYA